MEKHIFDAILGPGPKENADAGPGELELIAQELIEALHARNAKDVADTLRAAFELLDSESDSRGSQE